MSKKLSVIVSFSNEQENLVVLEKSNGPTQPSELAWLSPSWSLSGAGLLADCPQDTPGVLGAGGVQSVHPSAV